MDCELEVRNARLFGFGGKEALRVGDLDRKVDQAELKADADLTDLRARGRGGDKAKAPASRRSTNGRRDMLLTCSSPCYA